MEVQSTLRGVILQLPDRHDGHQNQDQVRKSIKGCERRQQVRSGFSSLHMAWWPFLLHCCAVAYEVQTSMAHLSLVSSEGSQSACTGVTREKVTGMKAILTAATIQHIETRDSLTHL